MPPREQFVGRWKWDTGVMGLWSTSTLAPQWRLDVFQPPKDDLKRLTWQGEVGRELSRKDVNAGDGSGVQRTRMCWGNGGGMKGRFMAMLGTVLVEENSSFTTPTALMRLRLLSEDQEGHWQVPPIAVLRVLFVVLTVLCEYRHYLASYLALGTTAVAGF